MSRFKIIASISRWLSEGTTESKTWAGETTPPMVWIAILMTRRPPRATQCRSSAASDVYKTQRPGAPVPVRQRDDRLRPEPRPEPRGACLLYTSPSPETRHDLVCRLLLAKK